jgi:hypothetical protein
MPDMNFYTSNRKKTIFCRAVLLASSLLLIGNIIDWVVNDLSHFMGVTSNILVIVAMILQIKTFKKEV